MEALKIRKTNRYVGTYRHLDEWETIGTIEELNSLIVSVDDDDPCEYTTIERMVRIRCDGVQPDERIERALRDTYTAHGCAHDYDCCGCWSHRVTDVVDQFPGHQFPGHKGTKRIYAVTIASSRNY